LMMEPALSAGSPVEGSRALCLSTASWFMSKEETGEQDAAASAVRNMFHVAARTVATAATAVVSVWKQEAERKTWRTWLTANTVVTKRAVVAEGTTVTAVMATISSFAFRPVRLFGTATGAIFSATCAAPENA